LPEGWVWCRLNDVCEYIQRGKSPKYTEDPKNPVISQKCVQWTGFDISRARFITEESLEKYGSERFLQKGDLLWNSTGNGTIGRVISYPGSDFRAFKEFVSTDYLWIFTASPLIQELVAGRVSGSTNQTELGTGTVKLMEFSFPPLEEQNIIVQKVNALMGLCDKLEQEVQESQEVSEQLMQSCLKEVFEN
jgi:type I restriction enzyme S subunit